MFARFRNLFAKSKSKTPDKESSPVVENPSEAEDTERQQTEAAVSDDADKGKRETVTRKSVSFADREESVTQTEGAVGRTSPERQLEKIDEKSSEIKENPITDDDRDKKIEAQISAILESLESERERVIKDILSKTENVEEPPEAADESCDQIESPTSMSMPMLMSNDSEVVNNPNDNSSILNDDLTTDVSSSPSSIGGDCGSTNLAANATTGESNDSVLESFELSSPSTTIVINPIDNNAMACNAITHKLTEISEVAESLDSVIREVQKDTADIDGGGGEAEADEGEGDGDGDGDGDADVLIDESNSSNSSDKKIDMLRSTSSEDWHSRSTEDESFVTASEGNFTPSYSQSSPFQTASGRTSSHISSGKNSFDADGELDDSTYATFDVPDLNSAMSMSFDGSEQSYLSAANHHHHSSSPPIDGASASRSRIGDGQPGDEECSSSTADIEELHSESVTPTPGDDSHRDGITIESETEYDASISRIADAPSMEILTECMPMQSVTPEVSPCASFNITTASSSATAAASIAMPPNTSNTNKPNQAAWRRSKYYENITKQTIRGFL